MCSWSEPLEILLLVSMYNIGFELNTIELIGERNITDHEQLLVVYHLRNENRQ